MRIADWLLQARHAGVDRLDAQLLLGHVLSRRREWLIAHDDASLSPAQQAALVPLLARRAAGEPLAYVLGECSFRGLVLRVTPDVLVPRPETELLVDWAVERLQGLAGSPAVVDLGTGSGAVALAIASACPAARVTASDASAAALAVAAANAARLGLAVEWLEGDWWAPHAGRRHALAVANPPYIAADDPHLAALGHEPASALTPGGDGLAALHAVIDGAPAQLLPGAWLLVEHGHDQGDAVRLRMRQRGLLDACTRADLAGLPRCSGAWWPGDAG